MYRRWLITSWPAFLLGLWLFADVLFGGRSWVFRDAGHFYFPSWSWLAEQHGQGDWAGWNPWVDLGASSVGEGSLGYFYPARLLWLLPISAVWSLKLLVLSHLVGAHCGAWRTAVRCGLGDGPATLAATCYACSAGVLFLVFNPPYLIGAAWLPWAMGATMELLERPSLRSAIQWAIPLAMLVLGGDAQMCCHVMLAAGLWWLLLLLGRGDANAALAGRRLAALAGGAILAGGLCAVQLLPARAWLQASDRVVGDAPALPL